MKQTVDQSLRKAASLSARGEVVEAEAIYRNVLERFPTNKRALDGIRSLGAPKDPAAYRRGLELILDLYDQGRLREALDHLRLLIDLYPTQSDLHNIAGAAHAGLGELDRAVEACERAVALAPDNAEAWSNLGMARIGLQHHDAALMSCDAAIALQPDNAVAHSNRGIALKQLGRLDEAVASHDRAVRLMPNSAAIHYNRGNALFGPGRAAEAVASYDAAIALQPTHVAALSNRGNALKTLGRLDEALDSYGRALALRPDFAEAHSNLGMAMLDLGRLDDAHRSCRKALELQPAVAEFSYNLAVVLEKMLRPGEALTAYDAALACDPNHVRTHGNRGHVLFGLQREAEAAESYARAIALDPGNANNLYALGNIVQGLGRIDDAIDCYGQAIALNPDHAGAIAQLAYQRARMCDWESGERPDLSKLAIDQAISPLLFVWLQDSPEQQLLRATRYASEKFPSAALPPPRASVRSGPIRIGYFSAEFHDHAVMFQLARMFELHDRERFSVHAYSFGPSGDSPMRDRLKRAFDVFHDVREMGSREIAQLARGEAIDIAIDLMGYTGQARTEIFAMRPAPVQIQYMGYPGTMGAPFVDYLVGDGILVPPDQRRHYAEKIIYLPESYQANDNLRRIADRTPSRAELGLPEQGFVFCCFNNSYKITPAEFDVWMRLLDQVDGSVLWLFETNARVEGNLRGEAAKRGLDPARLIFAGRMPHPEHMARLRRADLFLDCFQCNAHATAADALWAGVPLLTVAGHGYAARVGASVLHAIGLPEMAVATRQDYERIALELATDPARLADIRSRLAANRTTMPLFDSERFTRHIETAFELAYDRHWRGLAPDHVEVPALPTE
jgi:predicted O-linked N-acetylglucosamine transferase (SPINDLY family)